MTLAIRRDTNDHPYIEWSQGIDDAQEEHVKRAWISHRSGAKDWAKTGRYLHVARMGDVKPFGAPTFRYTARYLMSSF